MTDLIAHDRPPSRRGGVVTALLVLALAGWALNQHLSAPAAAPADSAPMSASPTAPPTTGTPTTAPPTTGTPTTGTPTTGTPTVAPTPRTVLVAPPSAQAPPPPPWAGLASRPRTDVDFALRRTVRADGRTYRLGADDRALTMDRAAAGPVVLVQSHGTTLLEQVRPDGSRLVLDQFTDESRHPQGTAVDPSGRRVAYALTSALPGGPFGLVVRDLATGAVLVDRRTRLPFGVRDWTPSGVVLTVALDPGGPPYRWLPGTGLPLRITPFSHEDMGPFLLAASPVRAQWAVTASGCTGLVQVVGRRPAARLCQVPLAEPAAWSPSGDLIAARGYRLGVFVLDVRTGRTTRLAVPAWLFVAQLEWSGDDTVLAVVHTLDGARGAVLACQVGGACRRLRLGTRGGQVDLALAR